MMRFGIAGVLVGTALLAASPALATTWDFGSATGDLGTSETYTNAGLTITAYGYLISGGATDLYGKNENGERGIGIASDPYGEHEISAVNFVNLDVHDLVNAGITNGVLKMDSVQPGEGYTICFGNSLGALGTNCFTKDLTRPILLDWGQYTVIGITGTGRDVLLGSLITRRDRGDDVPPAPVPEPATLVLLGSGLVSVALAARRRRAASKD